MLAKYINPQSITHQFLARPGATDLLRLPFTPRFTSRRWVSRDIHNHVDIATSISKEPEAKYEDFFRYTSGRWLWDEEDQLLARYKKFNVHELQSIAAESVGALRCVDMVKLAEGSFNKVFRLIMDNGRVAIVRVPNPNSGPAYYTTASEVATMDFVRTVLDIPTPKVFAWSADANNIVGSEYIVMEEAPGQSVGTFWETSELESKLSIMKDIVSIEKKLTSIKFTSYGSLYYADENISGVLPAIVISGIPADVQRDVRDRFVIGPVVEKSYWNKERSVMAIDRGPWKTPLEYISAIAHREIAWVEKHAQPRALDNPLLTSTAQNSPAEHIKLLQKYLEIIPYIIPSDPDLIAGHLWHKDLHSGNIFVDQTQISSLIDWQGTWVGPLYLQARHAKLIDYNGEIMLRPPPNFKELDDKEQARLRSQISKSIILHLYELNTAEENLILNKVFRHEHGPTRADPVGFAGSTWEDEILPFRESLIRIQKYWNELNIDEPCPIQFTQDELKSHAEDADGWNEVQDFWDSIENLVGRDGWTSKDQYDNAIALFSKLRQHGLKVMIGKEKDQFDRQTRWADRAVTSK